MAAAFAPLTALARHLQRLWWQPHLAPLTALLTPLAWLVGAESARRRAAAESGRQPAQPLRVPVVVVGNVIVGGAGKTPTVIALVALLRSWGYHPGIVSRGHGRADDAPLLLDAATPSGHVDPRAFGDEPVLMHRRTGAPVAVARHRREAALRLLQAHPEVDIVIADDGLQHHALPRDVEIVVFDGRGLGNGWTLPAGPLRERARDLWPAPAASGAVDRATGLAIDGTSHRTSGRASNDAHTGTAAPGVAVGADADATTPATPAANAPPRLVLVNGHWPAAPALALPASATACWEAQRALGGAVELAAWQRGVAADVESLDALRGRPLLAAAGIGDPERFFSMLEARGLRIRRLPLADHADFDPLPWDASTPDVVVTEKDAVKLAGRASGTTRVWVVTLDFRLPEGLAGALRHALAMRPPAASPTD